jgi:cellulose synthase operon protein C
MEQRVTKRVAIALLVAAVPLSLWSLTYTEAFREWRWSRATLAELRQNTDRSPNDPTLMYEVGTRLNAEGRYAEALPFLERAVGLDLGRAKYRDAWAKALLATGQMSQAFAILQEYARTHPGSPEGHLYLARFYVAQNATDRATEELDAVLRLKPGLGEAWWLYAVALQAQNEIPLATEKAREAARLEPRNAAYHALVGQLLLTGGDHDGALTAFDAALKSDPALVPALVGRARVLLNHRNAPAEALTLTDRALASDSANPEAHYLRGLALAALARPTEAVPALERAAELAPDDASPANELRRLATGANRARWQAEWKRRNDLLEEQRRLEEAHRQKPDDAPTTKALARHWARRGDAVRAVRYHAKALRSEQDAPPALIAAANDLTAGGHPDQAVALLKRVKAATQMNPASFEAMGDALLAQGLAREAALEYETAARWRPEKRAEFKKRLDAFFARQAAAPTEAMKLYAQAVATDQSRLGPRSTGNQVRDLLQRAITLEPKNTQIRREWVRILFERREREAAITAARELLEISPDDTVGHALLAVLLVEKAVTEAEFNVVQGHLNRAKSDPAMSGVVYYGAGLLNLRRRQNDAALVALKKAFEIAPESDPVVYALAQAYRANGKEAEAKRFFAEYQRRQDEKQAEVDLLKRVADNANQPAPYRELVAFYRKRGLTAQAEAVRQEFRRRFKAEP